MTQYSASLKKVQTFFFYKSEKNPAQSERNKQKRDRIDTSVAKKERKKMKFSDKNNRAYSNRDVFGVSFHDFIEKEKDSTYMELASEFGITMRDVKSLKKQLNRIQ
jgi:hypothetical protein